MSDRKIVAATDEPVSPESYCDLCGAAYFSDAVADRCCRSATPDGGITQPVTDANSIFRGLFLALGLSGWVWVLIILVVVFWL